jgi:hypothetical protein
MREKPKLRKIEALSTEAAAVLPTGVHLVEWNRKRPPVAIDMSSVVIARGAA